LGLSGRVPRRIDAATKTALIGLVDGAVAGGWSVRDGCRYLELSQRRLERWRRRVAAGEDLEDRSPGGNPVHGLTPAEEDEIVAVFGEWAEVDRSHRKLAHRGSWLGRFWADPSTVRRVLERRDLRFRGPKREGRSKRRPWPEWVEEKPNQVWIYDTTHWTDAGAATTVISDVGLAPLDRRHHLNRGNLDSSPGRVQPGAANRGPVRGDRRTQPRRYRL